MILFNRFVCWWCSCFQFLLFFCYCCCLILINGSSIWSTLCLGTNRWSLDISDIHSTHRLPKRIVYVSSVTLLFQSNLLHPIFWTVTIEMILVLDKQLVARKQFTKKGRKHCLLKKSLSRKKGAHVQRNIFRNSHGCIKMRLLGCLHICIWCDHFKQHTRTRTHTPNYSPPIFSDFVSVYLLWLPMNVLNASVS